MIIKEIMSRRRSSGVSAVTILLFLACLIAAACHRGPILPLAPLHTASRDPAQDHVSLASMYVRQATRSRELADEQANRALVYERLFGADSDWVSSAKLLARFYENAAREQEQQLGREAEQNSW